MNSKERVLAALRLNETDKIPFLDSYIDPDIEKILLQVPELSVPMVSVNNNKWENWGDFAKHGDEFELRLACSISPEFVKRFELDGFGIEFFPPIFANSGIGSDGREYQMDGLITSEKALKLMDLPDPTNESLYEPAKELLEMYGNDYAVYARIRLGASPTLLSMGLEGFAYALQDNPALIEKVLDAYTDFSAELVKHLGKLGFTFLWAFDDIAYDTGPMFSPSILREIFLPRMKKVANNIEIPWVYHSDGNLIPILDDLLTLGMNGLHPIQPDVMDIGKLKNNYGDRICLLGNIDIGLLAEGTPKEVENDVKEKISLMGKTGYIITSGNSIPNYCKPENVLAMIKAVHTYR